MYYYVLNGFPFGVPEIGGLPGATLVPDRFRRKIAINAVQTVGRLFAKCDEEAADRLIYGNEQDDIINGIPCRVNCP